MRHNHFLRPNTSIVYADDAKEDLWLLVRMRLPWLVVGLIGGIAVSYFISRFEEALSHNIALAFFLRFIVYMADAVGNQAETIYVRNSARAHANFSVYLAKEIGAGIILGLIFGLAIWIFADVWIGPEIALTVGLAMLANVTIAPVIAILVSQFLLREHRDPALGAAPFTTVLQDFLSIVIYFFIASLILFEF